MTFLRTSAQLAAVATTAAAALAAGPGPTASAAQCPDVEVVFARGTDEPAGIGRVGQAFVEALAPQVPGRTISTYAVDYPASYDFLAAADGAMDASRHIRAMVQQCPATRVVLGGYSQGAAVVDMLVGIPPLGNKIGALGTAMGNIGAAAPLAPDLASNVAAIAVFGNPSAKFSLPVTTAAPPYGGVAIDLCKDGDPICSGGRNPFAHKDYVSTGLTTDAANFVAGRV